MHDQHLPLGDQSTDKGGWPLLDLDDVRGGVSIVSENVIYKLLFCNLHLNCFFVIYIGVIYIITYLLLTFRSYMLHVRRVYVCKNVPS